MKRSMPKLLAVALALAMALSFLPGQVKTARAVSTSVVISQVYGAGGNSGALLNSDYVELYNLSSAPVTLDGWSIQYASATGNGNFGSNSNQITELSGTIDPGHYWLVQESSGSVGAPLPTPNLIDPTPIGMAAGAGKVALVDQTASLGCNGKSSPCSAAQLSHIIDLVGYGTGTSGANFYEGSGPAPTISATLADFRKNNGAQDTDNNSADFSTGTPNPRYTDQAPIVASTVPADGATDVPLNSPVLISFSEPVNLADGWFTLVCEKSGSHTAAVTGGPTSWQLTPDVAFTGGELCTLTVLADHVSDQDSMDPPDNMVVNFMAGFTTVAPTNPSASGIADPAAIYATDSTLLTVDVVPGINPDSTGLAVTCDLSSIEGNSAQVLNDNGDHSFTFEATVPYGDAGGAKSLLCVVSDEQGRSTTTTINLTVTPILTIGDVNGPISDTTSPLDHTSPYTGKTVTVQGVVYETTLQAIAGSTSTYKGFFIQNTADTADKDALTSDGVFVYMKYDTKIGNYTPQVGDEIVLTAKVTEYYNMTELAYPYSVVKTVRTGVDIESAVPPVVANPPVSGAAANRYWERLQGMRVQAPQDSIVLGGRNVFSPADAEIWLARSDSTIAERNSYASKAYRDAHPLDDNYDPNNWDGNGYRILIGSLGIKGAAGDSQAIIAPANSYETLTNAPAGGLNYTYSKYRIEITTQPTFTPGLDPAGNNPPQAVDRAVGYSIVDYNLENLYDFRDNPFSGCDFAGNAGCPMTGPYLSAVKPPYDYVPASQAAYQGRLSDIANQIINDLHSPDILMVQEVENQDICAYVSGVYTCGTTDNADGKPDVLQDLAIEIASQGGPAYDAAFDRDSSDLRGIAPSFLYRTDRVKLLSPVGDPILGTSPALNYPGAAVPANADVSNPKTFNAVLPIAPSSSCETNWVFPRAPDVGLFRIYTTGIGALQFRDVYLINNHFKSTPDGCVPYRTQQARYNAALVDFLQKANPEARIIVGGDLNVYPRPDDTTPATDQLGSLYDPALGLKNMLEVLTDQAPEAAYSYVYLGMAQTLDQMFVNQNLLADLGQFRIAHINSDFAADNPADVARGTSDHDPSVANFLFHTFNWSGFLQPVDNLPELNVAKAGSAIPVKFNLNGDQGLNIFWSGYPLSQKITCDASLPQDNIEQTLTAGNSSLQYDPLTGTYTYVWKTDKTWAGTCRQLVVRLSDGMYYTANFRFAK